MGESPGFGAGDCRFLREAGGSGGSVNVGVYKAQFDTHLGFEAKNALFCRSQLSLFPLFGLGAEIAVMTILGRLVTDCATDLSRQPRDQFLSSGCLHTDIAGQVKQMRTTV